MFSDRNIIRIIIREYPQCEPAVTVKYKYSVSRFMVIEFILFIYLINVPVFKRWNSQT